MGIVSRREFTKLCGGTVMAGVSLSAWPLRGEAAGQAEISGASLTGMTLTEASAKIRDRIVTPTQLTRAVLSRIELYDPKLNSYITVMREEALLQAAVLDEEQNAGKFRGTVCPTRPNWVWAL